MPIKTPNVRDSGHNLRVTREFPAPPADFISMIELKSDFVSLLNRICQRRSAVITHAIAIAIHHQKSIYCINSPFVAEQKSNKEFSCLARGF